MSILTTDTRWLDQTLEAFHQLGYAVINGVLDAPLLHRTKEAMYRVQDDIKREVGDDRLARAGELGVLRLMLRFDDLFFSFLQIPEVLAVVDRTVSPTAILHLQNGFILPSRPTGEQPKIFQTTYHQDFPRVLNGYLASINVMFAIDAFTASNGATWVVPGTQQQTERPSPEEIARRAHPVECPEGSMILFNSTLWHAAGSNTSGRDRLAINHQFTRSFIKQQIDYVRALGDEVVTRQPPRTQQLLGWYTRVVTSLDEYYQPEERRLYRKGQG
jgi:ectoine hydroxylase-related dioxygenase (phytanoyl-CoA dioxygenase family)